VSFTVDQAEAVRVLAQQILDCIARVNLEPEGERREQLTARIAQYANQIGDHLDAADGWRSMRPESRHGIWPEDYQALSGR
jgi:hypothetical protein